MKDLARLEHVVVLQLENRSFDHVFGGMSREDPTLDVDLEFTNSDHAGRMHPMLAMSDELAGVFPDGPGHSSTSIDRQIAGGSMSGFIRDFQDSYPRWEEPEVVMHYLTERHQPISYFFAREYTVLQRFFPSIATGTLPNRFYGLCGQSGGERDNSMVRQLFLDLPHIFDLVPHDQWAVYSGAFPTIALVGGIGELVTCRKNFRRITTFLEQARTGALPRLSWIEPVYSWSSNPVLKKFRVPEGPQNDDHPPSHTAHAQLLLWDVYKALLEDPERWSKTLLIVNYDEHGGFADHVPAPRIPDADVGLDGIRWMAPRVPAWLISPFAPRAGRNNTQFDHCSVLRFLADVFGVQRLGRAASANTRSIADALLDEPRAEPCPQPPNPPAQPRGGIELPLGDLGPVIANYLETLEREDPEGARVLRDNLSALTFARSPRAC
ncbi:MAG: alkaline phosphatase family protein [Kofleriaceae bacterium]